MKKSARKSSGEQESAASDPMTSPAFPPPPLEWEEAPQCLGAILRTIPLPVVVMCDRSCLPPMEHINFDFSQPLMLHTRRRVRKVVASNVVHVQHENETRLKDVGDCLLIPEDYKGWFAVLGPPNEVKPEKVVPYFRQVAQLGLSKCESFLIGGNEPVKAVQMPSSNAGANSRAQPRLLYPGDVLRMGKLYVGESTIQVKKSKLFGGKKTIKKEEKFLLCTDDNDRELYLPVENRGTFYVLTTEGDGTPRIPILRLKDICTHYRFPCMVKLLFGCAPATPCSFTGTLILRSAQIESSVIGCTMLNIRNILLDVPIDTDLKYYTARCTMELLSSRAYKSAKALCQERASTYMRNMKVAYYVNNEEDGVFSDVQEESRDDSETVSLSESMDIQSKLSKPRPSIVEDQELFCPPETASKSPVLSSRASNNKKFKKSVSYSEANPPADSSTISSTSPTVLRKDKTYNLPEPAESLPLRPSKSSPSLNIETRSLPPIVSPAQPSYDTLSNGHYMTMDESADQPSPSKESKSSRPDTRTPPPTPPKPRANKPIGHNRSDGCTYTQIWNGEAKVTETVESDPEKAAEKPSTPVPALPKRRKEHRDVQRLSSIALADNYLTLPVLRGDASSSTLDSGAVSTSESTDSDSKMAYYNTVSGSQDSCHQSEEAIYKVPSSTLLPAKQWQNPSSADVQPYEIMSSSGKTKREGVKQDSFDGQKAPTPPPKRRAHSSQTPFPGMGSPSTKLSPPFPDADAAPNPHDIVFENPSWMFSDTSSAQSCEYASRWLSSHHQMSSLDSSDQPYVHMQREAFTYFDGRKLTKKQLSGDSGSEIDSPVSETKDAMLDQNVEQREMEQASSTDESEAVYENIQNLRLCKERLSVSNSVSDISDDNPTSFSDKFENPPTMFGYLKAPPPRPVTPRKPPPVPKKPSFDKAGTPDGSPDTRASFQSDCSGEEDTRLPFPPKPCKIHGSPKFGYLHPCANSLRGDPKDYVHVPEDSRHQNSTQQPQACVKSRYSAVSQLSSEDNLPLGATFLNFRSRVSDSGAPESVVEEKDVRGERTSSMSVADLANALKDVGLTKETVEILRREKVDGRLLASLDEEELKEVLPGIKKLDIKKIQMFISMGWRPME